MSRRSLTTLLALSLPATVLTGLASVAAPPGAQAGVTAGVNGKFVFAADYDGDLEIYTQSGGTVTQLTFNTWDDYQPEFHPGGAKIAYVTTENGRPEVAVIAGTGGTPTNLTEGLAPAWNGAAASPTWSPNGARIAFSLVVFDAVDPDAEQQDIYTIRADGTGLARATNTPTTSSGPGFFHRTNESEPDWGVNGLIIYRSEERIVDNTGSRTRIEIGARGPGSPDYVWMNLLSGDAGNPVWSPDGSHFAYEYTATGAAADRDVYTMETERFLGFDTAANEGFLLTENTGVEDKHPTWSPDGRLIMYVVGVNGTDIVTQFANGTVLTRVNSVVGLEQSPHWQAVLQRCAGQRGTIFGTQAADVLTGTAGDDVIIAAGGADTVYGAGGNDVICGGAGNDVIYGGVGSDAMYGERGADTLRARDRVADAVIDCGADSDNPPTTDAVDPSPISCSAP